MLYGCVETTFDGCLGSKFGDDVLPILCGDYFINNQDFMESNTGFFCGSDN